jgi:hypothetical protein
MKKPSVLTVPHFPEQYIVSVEVILGLPETKSFGGVGPTYEGAFSFTTGSPGMFAAPIKIRRMVEYSLQAVQN